MFVECIIAGERSGVGKTTVTLALLAALSERSDTVQSFKVGPDYIDPMFHRAITGRPCYNLDSVLTSESYVKQCFDQRTSMASHAIVEGVMGLFDGATATDDIASTAQVARLLGLPVLLVVDCARMARSVAALVQGYRSFDSRVNVVGVILNRVGSDRHLDFLKTALAAIEMPIVGVLRRDSAIELPDRHLGLVPAEEVSGFQSIAKRLAELGNRCFDWAQLRRLCESPSKRSPAEDRSALDPTASSVISDRPSLKIAIATDSAFNFYYPDNLTQLECQGATLQPWSPINDPFPDDVSGLYLGGGFPEMFAEALAENKAARLAVKQATHQGLPTYAECGGLMYLSETLIDFDSTPWPMVGTIPTTVTMTGKLSLGYRRALTQAESPLVPTRTEVIGHEFHRSQMMALKTIPSKAKSIYQSQSFFAPGQAQLEGWQYKNVHASYIHLHWGDKPSLARRFVETCRSYHSPLPTP